MNVFKTLAEHYRNELPFVVYRKPNQNMVMALFQQDNKLYKTKKYLESGFVFTPFDDKEDSILIPKDFSVFLKEESLFETDFIFDNKQDKNSSESFLKNHLSLVEKGIDAILSKSLKKVVLSRKEIVAINDSDILTIFKRLLKKYSTAFVYVWFHPKVGLWLGATPETLLKVTDNTFATMSLAGTQLYNGVIDVSWKKKEIEEQQFVTDYIIKQLNKVCEKVNKQPVETIKAGNLLHLKTTISGKLNDGNMFHLINSLHPTPAVCGLPKLESKEFILTNEGYAREFYTGFLGELNFLDERKKNNSSLFVNLRCMKLKGKTAEIYVGGGITKDSKPEDEFYETVVKANTMKTVLG